jgi:glycosyltransferase involved in cell wall biosynthesis
MKHGRNSTSPVAVFIPVYNEEKILSDTVARLMDYLDGVPFDYTIVIVSNGSTDSTVKTGERLAAGYGGKIIFSHTRERGAGHAFRRGVSLTGADRIVTVDADLTTGLGFIPRAVELLERYDIVVGSKALGSQSRRPVRIIGSRLFIFLVRALLGLPYGDYSIGGKAFRREIIMKHLDSVDGVSSYALDIIYRAWRDGARIIETPVHCDDTRKSRFNLIQEGIYRLRRLFILRFGKG